MYREADMKKGRVPGLISRGFRDFAVMWSLIPVTHKLFYFSLAFRGVKS